MACLKAKRRAAAACLFMNLEEIIMSTIIPVARRDMARGPAWDTIVPISNNADFVFVAGFALAGLSLTLAAAVALPSFVEPLVQLASHF